LIAYFFKKKFLKGIFDAGLHVISKMRKDAKLLKLYSGQQKKRGRRKKFDGIVNFDDLFDDLEDVVTDDPTITLRSTIAYSVALEQNVLVIMLRKKYSNGKIMAALLFSSDVSMNPVDAYNYYRTRFQIEFVIRDAKQYGGLEHCQSLVKERIDFHINMSFSAINIARIKEHERNLNNTNNAICFVANQRVRFHNEMLIKSIFPMLGLDLPIFKSHPAYENALSFGAIHA
jgi:hypothetical protein